MSNWLVQATPKAFDIISYLQNYADKEDNWIIGIPSFVDQIKKGDKVFVWKSKGKDGWRGIIGKAIVTNNPSDPDLVWFGERYWCDDKARKRAQSLPSFDVKYKTRITKKLLRNPIKEEEISKTVPDLVILRSWRRGIYLLTDEQVDGLNASIDKR